MLLPADSYIVINKSIITELDKKVLIDLFIKYDVVVSTSIDGPR